MQSKPSTFRRREELFDLEQQFILRLPTGPSIALRRDVQAGSQNLKDKLSIEIQSDMRRGIVRYGGQVFTSKLMDLPCVVESLKTTDQKTFYKTADISQILLCLTEEEAVKDEKEIPKKRTDKEKDKRFVFMHGLTPPVKNVRKRRFRKTLKKKNIEERPDIEKEVRRLFRTDAEAIDVQWELITDEDKPLADSTNQAAGLSNINSTSNSPRVPPVSEEIAEHDIFGEVSSSDEEEKEVNIMDNSEEDMIPRSSVIVNEDSQGSMSAMFPGIHGNESDTAGIREQLSILEEELHSIREKRKAKEVALVSLQNSDLKEQLETELEVIKSRELEKQKEYKMFSSMFGHR